MLKTNIDNDRLIYNLEELKDYKDQIYYYYREYIQYGYRAHPKMTWSKCTSTLCMVHCETFNVWTHLAATIYFGY